MLEELCPDMIFDPKKLRDVDPRQLTEFLSTNATKLGERIEGTAQELLSQERVPGNEPAFAADPDFQKKWYDNWHQSLCYRVCEPYANRSIISFIIPATVYLHDCYNVSCSRVILGCEMPVVPPSWVRAWIAQVDMLSPVQERQLFDILAVTPVRCDTVYILKSRLEEMAVARGETLPNFLYYPGFIRSDRPLVVDGFAKAVFTETGNAYSDIKPYLGKYRMLRMIIAMAILYQVSPDYLLLQDYNDYAVTPNGKRYSATQRAWLSRLLSADAATRARAIGYVMAQTAIGVSQGNMDLSFLMDVKKATQGQGDTLNITEMLSSAPAEWSKDKIETAVVDQIKDVVMAALRNTPKASASKLFTLVDGDPAFVRRALYELEKEGSVKRATDTVDPYWELASVEK